ncbi:CDP-diacylglycerol--glycerol-3-phosphate 3-phosphatidyltransferase [Sporolactobacillus inulinus]|uniref:CDP-diacylglycerol--glycerol-3-phosphate 3-phosphatidyltransferase n=1 Tax=Sporolactobacillus inulinus CASD TaxID=1069536 RepID=A0A0U1QMF6_9BACL|nr:CDP-diacylglycerol--glycerol-3-phosphate 3-phosphatidyltransferase [Sporolactobacillus inulinus]KLI01973.1 CDP-diacylglycerol--glycerol-3-phosphate 3-phosphatidyltransferase [Sporolactobacillus inulinus CASD]GEB75956.1 CDP-diacylglycerol--glycerol-3-phosphate 3-phosphatidyltransferase [Sporolactobacillus inulinus]
MNIANKLTVARMIMIPVFLILLLVPMPLGAIDSGNYHLSVAQLLAAVIFMLASFTDWLDGQLARKYHLVTNFGKLLDPLADKLLVMSAFVAFVGIGRMASWMVILILAREFAVTGLRLVAVEEGEVIAASKIAKWKTFSQMVAIILFLFNNVPFGINGFPLEQIILWIAVFLTVFSGVDYFYKNRELVFRSK